MIITIASFKGGVIKTTTVVHLAAYLQERSPTDFEQITGYIRRDTHQAVRVALVNNGRKEFSELVEGLLRQWLKSHK